MFRKRLTEQFRQRLTLALIEDRVLWQQLKRPDLVDFQVCNTKLVRPYSINRYATFRLATKFKTDQNEVYIHLVFATLYKMNKIRSNQVCAILLLVNANLFKCKKV